MFLGYNNENYYINRREKNIELTNLNGLTNSLMKILKIMNIFNTKRKRNKIYGY